MSKDGGKGRERFRAAQALHQRGRLAEAAAIYQEILRRDPGNADALHFLGLVALQTGQTAEGTRLIEQAVARKPACPAALGNLGNAYAEAGRPADALMAYDRALRLDPRLAEVHDNRGSALLALGQLREALASHDRAIALRPGDAGALCNRGNALRGLGRHAEALCSYDAALAIEPGFVEARCNRAATLQALGRYDDALACFDQAIAQAPGLAGAHDGRGNVLRDLGRPADALAAFDRAVQLAPAYAEAHVNRANALFDLGRHQDALASCDRALALRPGYAEAHNNRGNALRALRRLDEAVACYRAATGLRADYAEACYNAGLALLDLSRPGDALVSLRRAIDLTPDHAEAHRMCGQALAELKRYREALASYREAFAREPEMPLLRGEMLAVRGNVCDWSGYAVSVADIERRVADGQLAVAPFVLMGFSDAPALHRRAAEAFAAQFYPVRTELPPPAPRADATKIRLGYFSADFRDHAMMHVMIDLFDRHDRSRFELYAFSFGPDTGDAWRLRVQAAFDRFIDVRAMSDRDVAELARRHQIDIAVDLMGYTKGCRAGIFRYRAAPAQVGYLGYPGTSGLPELDYVLADRVVAPPGLEPHFSERVVRLPDCYQFNGPGHVSSGRQFDRTELGLPEDGFVFCCFNNNFKITPLVFDLWMNILRAVDGSVLWLLKDNAEAADNLRAEASARGVAPERLVFAERLKLEAHLARQRLADLFLDTLPYNGHATASLALWAGLPVLTRPGEAMPGRVAASLLDAIGLPELIAPTPAAYEATAIRLATQPAELASIKVRLEQNKLTAPLFDPERSVRNLEAAYRAMLAEARNRL